MNNLDPSQISPGLIGFLATFAIVVVSVLLFLSMTRHLRKVTYRSQHLPVEPPDEQPDERPEERPEERPDEDGDAERDRPSEP